MAEDIIRIVVASDNNYIMLLAALIKSIERNHKTSEKIKLYIIDDNISVKSRGKLIASIDKEMTSVRWVALEEAIPPRTELPEDESSFPFTTYLRLFVHNFLEEGVNKVIYLDVDMIVQTDISELWNIDLGEKVIGAVTDTRVKTFNNSWGGGVPNYADLGLDGNLKYFNAGTLLIDLENWKANDTTRKVIECVNANTKYTNFPDQYGLNVVLANKWMELEIFWNYFVINDFTPEAKIIHYIATKPIYTTYSGQPGFKKIFFKYLNQTQWKGFKEISGYKMLYKKIMTVTKKGILLKRIKNKLFK